METEICTNKMFKLVFSRVELILLVLQYYDLCDRGIKIWRQLSKFTRTKSKSNQKIISTFIRNKRTINIKKLDLPMMEFLTHWMKFFNLNINAHSADINSNFYRFLVELKDGVYEDSSIQDLHLDKIVVMKKHINYADTLKLLKENIGFESLINCSNLLVNKCNYIINWKTADLYTNIENVNRDEEFFCKYLTVHKVNNLSALKIFCNKIQKPVRYLQFSLCASTDIMCEYTTIMLKIYNESFSSAFSSFDYIKEDNSEPVCFQSTVLEYLDKITLTADFEEEGKVNRLREAESDINIIAHNDFLCKILASTQLQRVIVNFNMDMIYDIMPPNIKLVFKKCVLNVFYERGIMTVIADEIAITLNHQTVSSFEYNYDRTDINSKPIKFVFKDLYNATLVKSKCVNLSEFRHKRTGKIVKFEISDEFLESIELNPFLFYCKSSANEIKPIENSMLTKENMQNLFYKQEDKLKFKWENTYELSEQNQVSLESICEFLPKAKIHEIRQEYWDLEKINFSSNK